MNSKEAQQILLLYRSGTSDANDLQIAEALAVASQDPALREWLERQQVFHAQVRQKLRGIPVPADLKERVLGRRKIIPLRWWQQPAGYAAAAAIVLLGLSSMLLLREPRPDKFVNYRERMVRSALRNYKMDILTNDPEQVRRYAADKGGPADYTVPTELQKLQTTGGGLLNWRGHPVTMVCFDRGQKQMIFLFVINKSAIKDAPSSEGAELEQVNQLPTVSWTAENKTYLLAGEISPDALKRYSN